MDRFDVQISVVNANLLHLFGLRSKIVQEVPCIAHDILQGLKRYTSAFFVKVATLTVGMWGLIV